MAEYEARRLENIKRNQALVKNLNLGLHNSSYSSKAYQKVKDHYPSPAKRRRLYINSPRRSSARIANALAKPPNNPRDMQDDSSDSSSNRPHKSRATKPSLDIDALVTKWSSWTLAAPPPTRDDEGNYHFASHPTFTPNKSPEAIIREGSFGGTYWRPLYSRHLRTTITDDWKELPAEWTEGLDVGKYLTSETVNPEVNKYGVACGQTIEQWEASGWIMHEYDVRGWFQWYCRFWQGRRCPDDNRQVSRWQRCVGEKGRWRRVLLKGYVENGIRSVTDEGNDHQKEDVSPAIHQTCHHWAWEVRQEALDRFWEESE
ncbi:hypothetical protein F5Y00DRAFT_273531 [Daldinia vernicosa]|uniref:uncharacterized protein n=1 Tax=Daldinia vernicosa TaxID=114800 RepID=UPI0020079325|nr:uncharacterized protein F5Y00DRAFT_273531 [Daldinia vernicosa]KAI0844856.1 hypothetical protein F5Y00DRAFT_273531 [Daldinia vernicosa]